MIGKIKNIELINNLKQGLFMYEYKIKEVIKIYDGDTITVLLDLGFNIYKKEVIRLYGIDTPEIRGKERPEGLISRDRLVQLIEENPDMYVKTHKDKAGKYGRMLGELCVPGFVRTLNEMLVDEGLAEAYYGGKR